MDMKEIESLPIAETTDENSVIFLWTIQKYLPLSFTLLDKWGFRYQRTLTRNKKNGMFLFGFHHRNEFVLFGYKVKLEMYPKQKSIPNVFTGKSERQQARPDEFYTMIENLGNKHLDIFARKKREGRNVFGSEVRILTIYHPYIHFQTERSKEFPGIGLQPKAIR